MQAEVSDYSDGIFLALLPSSADCNDGHGFSGNAGACSVGMTGFCGPFLFSPKSRIFSHMDLKYFAAAAQEITKPLKDDLKNDE